MLTRFLRWWGLFAITACSGVLLSVAAPPDQLAATLRDTARHPQSTVDAHGVESVATTVVAALAWLTVTWLVLAILLVAASNAPGRVGALATVASAVLVPATTQRLIAATLGVTLLTGLAAGTASAAPSTSPATSPTTAPGPVSALDLDWPSTPNLATAARNVAPHAPAATAAPAPTPVPDTTFSPAPAPITPGAAPPRDTEGRNTDGRDTGDPATRSSENRATRDQERSPGAQEVVVLRGESLWTIAARSLGPAATNDQIAREWPRWWAANRQVIGDNPDLIKPGLRLTPPTQHRPRSPR